MNQKESFRPILIPIKTNLFLTVQLEKLKHVDEIWIEKNLNVEKSRFPKTLPFSKNFSKNLPLFGQTLAKFL